MTTPSTGINRRSLLKSSLFGAGAIAAPSLLTACAPKSSGGGSSKGNGPIRIGVISPLSGAWTVYGKAHSAGFELAVDEINAAGGTLGRQWEIVIADSKTEPQVVTEQANRLVREEKVDFLAGTFSSAERNAAAPVATQADKLLLYPTFYEGQSEKFYPGVCNPNVFMFGPEPSEQVWPHMEYMVKKHGGKFFMIGSDYVWPRETNRLTKQKLQGARRDHRRRGVHPVQHPAVRLGAEPDPPLRCGRRLLDAHRFGHGELPASACCGRNEEGPRGLDGR